MHVRGSVIGPWIDANVGLTELVNALGVTIAGLEPEMGEELRLRARDYRDGDLTTWGLLGAYQAANAALTEAHGLCWATSEDAPQSVLSPVQ